MRAATRIRTRPGAVVRARTNGYEGGGGGKRMTLDDRARRVLVQPREVGALEFRLAGRVASRPNPAAPRWTPVRPTRADDAPFARGDTRVT